MKKVPVLFFLLLLITSCSSTTDLKNEEDHSQEMITNPILAGWYPDPSITDDGQGNFYMVHSTFAFFPGIPIFHSNDLVNWRQIGNVLDRPEQLQLEGFGVSRAIFAPDISYNNGTFYLTCTVVDGKGNFVVTASDPAGPWSNPVWLPEVSGIDPGLFFDDTKTYLVYNSEAPDNKPLYSGHRTIRMVEFDQKELKVVGENRILVNGGVDITKKPIWAEGPRIYKLNGYYYLMTAEGGTAIEHSEVIYRTRDINSDFVPYENNPILTQRHLSPDRANPITSAGHADLVQHPNGDWYGIFLACRDYGDNHYNTGRETFIAPVRWQDDWPVFDLGGESIQYQYPLPKGTSVDKRLFPLSGNFSFTDTFDADTLAYHWMFLRTLNEKWFDLRDGKLIMSTRPETIAGRSNPSFLGHRQQHLKGEVITELEFFPTSEAESAGIVAFQNETHYYYLSAGARGGKQVVQVEQGGKEEVQVLASAPLNTTGPLKLKIAFDTDVYRFFYNTNGEWVLLGESGSRYLSTKEAGGFVGVTLAMYTTSSGKESSNQASFHEFTYTGDDEVYKD